MKTASDRGEGEAIRYAVRRNCERVQYNELFNYTVTISDPLSPRRVEAGGRGIDICMHKRGMGFYTEFPLEPGHVIHIRRDGEDQAPAVVKWVKETGVNYRVGVYLFR